MNKLILWMPRVIAILFAAFISIFAADAINEGVLAIFMHLIPTMILATAIVIAWKFQKIGGSIFVAAGCFHTFLAYTHNLPWAAYMYIAVPCVIIGSMFIVSSKYKPKVK